MKGSGVHKRQQQCSMTTVVCAKEDQKTKCVVHLPALHKHQGDVRSVCNVWGSFRILKYPAHLSEKVQSKTTETGSCLSAKRNRLNRLTSYFQISFEDRHKLTGVYFYRFGGRGERQKVPRQQSCIHKHKQAYSCPAHNQSTVLPDTRENYSLPPVKPLVKEGFISQLSVSIEI